MVWPQPGGVDVGVPADARNQRNLHRPLHGRIVGDRHDPHLLHRSPLQAIRHRENRYRRPPVLLFLPHALIAHTAHTAHTQGCTRSGARTCACWWVSCSSWCPTWSSSAASSPTANSASPAHWARSSCKRRRVTTRPTLLPGRSGCSFSASSSRASASGPSTSPNDSSCRHRRRRPHTL